MSDSSLCVAGSTCIKKKILLLLPPRENDWLVATEWWTGYEILIKN